MANLLRRIGRLVAPPPPKPPEPLEIEIAGRTITVVLKTNVRARRLILRLNKNSTAAVLTLPPRMSRIRAIAFVEQSRPWLEQQFAKAKPKPQAADGSTILLRGEQHTILSPGGRRGIVTCDEANRTITVPGDAAHVERRLKDWMKKQALAEMTEASRHYAKAMGTDIGRITVRDQSTRWGSCSPMAICPTAGG